MGILSCFPGFSGQKTAKIASNWAVLPSVPCGDSGPNSPEKRPALAAAAANPECCDREPDHRLELLRLGGIERSAILQRVLGPLHRFLDGVLVDLRLFHRAVGEDGDLLAGNLRRTPPHHNEKRRGRPRVA